MQSRRATVDVINVGGIAGMGSGRSGRVLDSARLKSRGSGNDGGGQLNSSGGLVTGVDLSPVGGTRGGRFDLSSPGVERATHRRRSSEAMGHGRMSSDGMMSDLTGPKGLFRSMFNLPAVVSFISAEAHSAIMPAPGAERLLRRRIRTILNKVDCKFGFAAGITLADIVFLETVRARGGEIYLVVPVTLAIHLHDCARRFQRIEPYIVDVADEDRDLTYKDADEEESDADAEQQKASDARANGHRSFRESILSSSSLMRRLKNLVAAAERVDVANDLSPDTSVTNRHYSSLLLHGLALKKAKTMGTRVECIYAKPELLRVNPDDFGEDDEDEEIGQQDRHP